MAKFPTKVLSSAALTSAAVVVGFAGTASAAVDGYLVKDAEGTVYSFDKAELEQSYMNYVYGDGDSALYEYFQELFTENGFYAFSDDSGNYVAYDAIEDAYLEDTEGFDLNEFTEAEDAPAAEVSTVTKVMVEDGEVVTEEVTVGQVEVSVKPLNLKQLEVTLGDNLDSDTVEDASNYDVETEDGSSIDIANVSYTDGKAVITFEEALSNQTYVNITLDDDVTGEELTFEDLYFFDDETPDIVGVEAVGKNVVKVKFSEPMNFGELDEEGSVTDSDVRRAFQLNDGNVFVKDVKVVNNGTEANVYFYSNLDEGKNTISVGNDVTDYAGFITGAKNVEFTVELDEEGPEVVEVKNVTSLKATLVFNEDLDPTTVSASDFYHTNSSLTAEDVDVDGNVVTVTWDEDDALPNGTVYIYVKAESVKDLWGNANDQQLRLTAEVDVDEDAPVVEKVESVSQDTIKITFNEEVKSGTATDEDNYELLNEDGDELDIDDITEVDEKTVEITLEEDYTGGLTINIDGVADIYGNEMDEVSVDFYMEDTVSPDITSFNAKLYEDGDIQTLVITFDGEKMATSGEYSVLDLDKYNVHLVDDKDNTAWKLLSKLDGVKISAVENGKQVQIELDTDEAGYSFSAGTNVIEMAQVADAAGNKSQFSGKFDIEDRSDASFGLTEDGVYAVDKNTVKIHLADYITDLDEAEFELYYYDEEKTLLTITGKDFDNSGSDGTVITFTIDESLDTDATYGGNTVYFATDGETEETTNRFGNGVDISETEVGDKVTPELDTTADDDDDDETYTVKLLENTVQEFDLVFTEGVEGQPIALGTYLTIDDYEFVVLGEGESLSQGEFTIKSISGTTVTIEIYTEDDDKTEIKLDANKFLTDGVGNKAEFQDTVTLDVYEE